MCPQFLLHCPVILPHSHLNPGSTFLLLFSSLNISVRDTPSTKAASGSWCLWIVLLLPGAILSHHSPCSPQRLFQTISLCSKLYLPHHHFTLPIPALLLHEETQSQQMEVPFPVLSLCLNLWCLHMFCSHSITAP